MVTSYSYLEVSRLTNDWEEWVWCFLSVRHPGLIPVHQKNSCTLLFSGLRSPLAAESCQPCSPNKWSVDECAARLQPLSDHYKTLQHQTFAIEKLRESIVTTQSCPRDKNKTLKKVRIVLYIYIYFCVVIEFYRCVKISCNGDDMPNTPLPVKCPIYEMSYLRNVLSMKCPI